MSAADIDWRREPDAEAIGEFVRALFVYAEEGAFVSLRAFEQSKRNSPPRYIVGARSTAPGWTALLPRRLTARGSLRITAIHWCSVRRSPPSGALGKRQKPIWSMGSQSLSSLTVAEQPRT
jgi:hypothetical protein